MEETSNDWFYKSNLFQSFFKTSHRSLVLKANPPYFTILAASDDYLQITHSERDEILNKNLFDAFPGSLSDPDEKNKVYGSLLQVIHTKAPDVLPTFKYEIYVPETNRSLTQYWSNINEPVPDDNGNVAYIINTTINITDQVLNKQALEEAARQKEALDREQQLNEILIASNKELHVTQLALQKLKNELEARVDQRTTALQQSEATLRTIIEQAPVAMSIFRGPQFIIELFNEKMLEFWGKTVGQVEGRLLFTALPEASGQGFEELLTNVLITGKRFSANEMAVTLFRNDKLETVWMNFIYEPLYDENNTISRIIVVCNEITEQVNARKRLERIVAEKTVLEVTLRNNQQRLQSILDTMAEGVGIVNEKGQMVYANTMAQRILGLTESEIKERTYDDPRWQNLKVDGFPLPDDEHPMSIMMKTGMPVYDYEIGVKPPDKDIFYVSVNAAPLFDEQGKISGGIGTFMDVTIRRKITQQKDEFISVASHELKTPLTSLKASLQLLSSLQGMPEHAKVIPILIEQSVRNVDKLNSLVNDLLDVNRISRGHIPLKKTVFTIADMAKDCCRHVTLAGTHNITVKGDLAQTICADEQRISQVVINFVNNAVKYAPASRQIDILIETLENKVKILVTDFGTGVPKDKQANLFDRYYRGNNDVGQGGGLGLGLYISSEIIKSHHGEIGMNSEQGKGSTFWFTLPVIEPCDETTVNSYTRLFCMHKSSHAIASELL